MQAEDLTPEEHRVVEAGGDGETDTTECQVVNVSYDT